MTVEVSSGNRTVYKSSFSICQMRREDIPPDQPQRLLSFFPKRENRSVLGEPSAEQLEGNIWEAGEDPNDVIIGISFATKERVWLNSLHILQPGKISRSTLGNGLVITTYPAQNDAPERQGNAR